MGDLSLIQIVMVLVIALLVFGPGRMPEIGRQLGKGLRDLRRHASSMSGDLVRAIEDDEPARPQAPSRPSSQAPRPALGEPVSDGDLMAGVVVDGSADSRSAAIPAPTGAAADEMLDGVVVPGSQPPTGHD